MSNIKDFSNFNQPINEDKEVNKGALNKFKMNKEVFQEAYEKVGDIIKKELLDEKDEDINWEHVGSLGYAATELVDIIEGWDEDLAEKLREKLGENK